MKKEKFRFLEHTADIKFQSFGKTLEEAFENAALALQEAMTKGIKIRGKIKKKIQVKGKDKEALLYNFLEEFLFLLDSKKFLLSRIKNIKITRMSINNKIKRMNKSRVDGENDNKKLYNYRLIAEVTGDKASNYKFSNDVKAITYNEMLVKKEKTGKGKFKYVCQVVADV